jgi:hypothetical protein
MVTCIVKKSCPWPKHKMYELMNVGFREDFKLVPPMERVQSRQASAEQMDRFDRRAGRELWPWQARCACGRVRDRKELDNHGGKCERCHAASDSEHKETEHGSAG